jgi:hypothetical protein
MRQKLKPRGKPFVKGDPRAGRPKGSMNKATAAIKTLAEPYSAEAVKVLAGIMRDTKAPDAARIAACRELIDRGHGKARETLRHEGIEPAKLAVVQISNASEMRALLGTAPDVDAGEDDADA